MLLTTTPDLKDKKVIEYLGLVTGEVIMGTNPIKDIAAGLRELVGSRSKEYEESLIKAREIALKELEERATAMGANAVISIDLDFEQVTQHNMIMVCASGTAVKYE
ncbi:MAG: YbjQ family protein [Microcystaceae cyanobacterium]